MARIPQALRRVVLAAAQDRCAYCLSPEQMMGVAFEIDHILPSSAGGRTQFDNLCLSCPTCNRHKAKRLSARDPLSGRVVTLFHPHRGHGLAPTVFWGHTVARGWERERLHFPLTRP